MSKKYGEDCKGGEDCRDENHLCRVVGRKDPDEIRTLIRDAKYFCRKCGRSAREASNLCKPLDI